MMPVSKPRIDNRTDLGKTPSPVDVRSQPEEEVLLLDSLLGFTGVGVVDQGAAEAVVSTIRTISSSIISISMGKIRDREETRASGVEVEVEAVVSSQEDLNQARRKP